MPRNNHVSQQIKKDAMLAALEKALGVVSTAAKNAGIDRATHYDWLKDDEEYRKKVESLKDLALDFAESKLFQQINKGDTTANIFYLKTQGKKRGYIEKQEFDHTSAGEKLGVVILPPRTDNNAGQDSRRLDTPESER